MPHCNWLSGLVSGLWLLLLFYMQSAIQGLPDLLLLQAAYGLLLHNAFHAWQQCFSSFFVTIFYCFNKKMSSY
jgi:hypothetical protein